jgi:hypothetical protein
MQATRQDGSVASCVTYRPVMRVSLVAMPVQAAAS